ncbi:MAG: translation initiation factor IF-2 [Oscillospiraceae bacterium]|nr:translation initiation factor IF-2 [Oscillospiraceae bacterium]
MQKYRVHEVAKDLGQPSKSIIELLGERFPEPKKHMTALTEEELDYVFEHFTKEKAVENFDRYFTATSVAPVKAEKKAPKAEKAPAKEEAPAKEAKPAAQEKPAGAKPVEMPAEEKAAPEKPAEKPVEAEKPVAKEPVVEKAPAVAKGEKPKEERAPVAAQPAKPQPEAAQPVQKPVQQAPRAAQPQQRPQGGNAQGRPAPQRPAAGGQQGGGQQRVPQFRPNLNQRPAGAGQNGNRPQQQGQNRPQQGKPAFSQGGRPQGQNQQGRQNPPRQNQPARPAQPPKAAVQRPTSNVPPKNLTEENGKMVRRVDTKSAHVILDKYNEKYETIAPQFPKSKQELQSKQKLNQKSATYRNKNRSNAKRETEAERLKRIAAERQKKVLKITVGETITVGELAAKLKATAAEVIKKLFLLGVMATVNQEIDFDTAELVSGEFNAKVEREVVVTIEDRLIDTSEDLDSNLVPRSPVVVVMGHVDHGKTSILDAIRHSDVTASEAGGITQHIGAYRVKVQDQSVTFLDTPGHAAFTSMRARGAQVTDIAVLVVAADDGIMPQTVEAINHAKAAGVSIIVAINKMDKPEANPDRVKQELTEYELVPEEWGGDVICVPVSAVTKQGIEELLENILLVAEVKELKANPDRLAKGTVIEAKLDKGRGPIATVLVQNGTLKTGDVVIAGTAVGRVRVMQDDKGRKIETAGPSVPVEITGLAEVPAAGDVFNAVEDERLARELAEQRKQEEKEERFKAYQKVTLDNLFSQIEQGEMKELALIVKADVQGSVEAVKQSLEKLSNDEVRVRVIHGAVGAVTESDVSLATASNAIIVGFNVRPDPLAKEIADQNGVDMRLYRIIYDAIEEMESAMKGMLAPKFRDVDLGRAEVRDVFRITNVGVVSGCYVLSGKITRTAKIRIVRDGIIIADDMMSSLKRFKDDVKEVAQGYECGITLEKFNDVHVGDVYEAYITEEYRDE